MDLLPKILVASTIYEAMDYCIDEFVSSISVLNYPNYQVLIVDNSRNQNFFDRLKDEYGIKIIKDSSKERENIKRLIGSRNKIIDYAIKEGYHYILMMDCDVIPPLNIITELLNNDKDIISGLYYNYFNYGDKLVGLPCALRLFRQDEIIEARNMGLFAGKEDFFDLHIHLTQKDIDERKPIEVTLPCAGCMMMKRKVFESVRYKHIYDPKGEKRTDESFFITECRRKKFEIFCHTGVRCTHRLKGKLIKDEEGKYFHPIWEVR